jgi:excisionase family DNA binding protein
MESIMRKRRDLGRGIAAGQIYTVPELARELKIGSQTIYNKLSKGESLPKCFRVGNKVRFRGQEILSFIEEQLP